MSEDKFVKNMLSYQENLDGANETRKIFLKTQETIFEAVLEVARSQEDKDKIQEAYDEYIRVEEEVFKEKGGSATSDDIKERIPENYWIELTSLNRDEPEIDFDAVEKRIMESLDFDELRKNALEEEKKEAEKKGKIN
ncbi:MAG: hypothetical protein PF549_04695 [Patescibacteria group bacterium]|jgi:hypothetical protein|nr:hypothetical protein [Patescibacteria group bacterium]